jgi:DNA-binding PadR family transcriptional regulator
VKLKSDEFLILAVLCDGDLHASGIMQAAYRISGGGLVLRAAGLHGVLRRLKNRGLIEAVEQRNPEPGAAGHRSYYRITSAGRQVVQMEAEDRAKGH